MIRTDLSIRPDYLEKAREFIKVKTDFQNWAKLLEGLDGISLEESLGLLNKFGIQIPRILMLDADYRVKLYRTRVIPSGSKEDLSVPRTFSYPPAGSCLGFQRANAPGYPVFYGALDAQTALEELRVNGEKIKENDTIFLSEWRIKPGVKFNLANLTLPEIVEDHQVYGAMTKKVFSEFARIFKDQDAFFAKTQVFLFEQLSKLFLKGKYVQSGIIAHQIIYNTPETNGIRINGIIYPSVSNEFRSANCALHPDFVDSCLEMESVQKFTFREFKDDRGEGSTSYYGECAEGKVVWKTLTSELMLPEFKVELALDPGWTQQEISSARCFYRGAEIDLMKFCGEKVNRIDLSENKISQKDVQMYKDNTEGLFFYDQRLADGLAYLQLGDRKNGISVIRILIPMITGTKVVGAQEVLNSSR